ncbi:MAG: energy transducer TonB [Myxococcales bacterium]|nr:energy transducer TonB [Myxococcales bacterium]
MAARRTASRGRLVGALLAALAAHALLGWLLAIYGVLSLLGPRPPTAPGAGRAPMVGDVSADAYDPPIEIQTLVDQLRSPDPRTEAEKRSEEQKRKDEEDPNARGQVVDIPQPTLEERPDASARFLAEYDSRVERETKGKPGKDRAGGEGALAINQPRVPAEAQSAAARAGLPGVPQPARRQRGAGSVGQDGPEEQITQDGVERRAGTPGERARAPAIAPGQGGAPGRAGADRPNLVPSEEMLARSIGKGAGSPDYLKDIDDGESTALNAKKFKYASFFNRVKRAVSEEWHPDLVYVRHDPSGNVYGTRDRVTVLRVHLHPGGKLQTVNVIQASGVEFLDDEAIDAFRRAQPFVNPPTQLVDADGLIHFNFGFIFELSGQTRFKVFKYQ